jgi:hypothetical protein
MSRKNTWNFFYTQQLKSDYDKSDYRSRFFLGLWQKHFIDDICEKILNINKSFFDIAPQYNVNKNEHLPSKFYKFYSANLRNIVMLESQCVYLASPKSFNDPYDCYISANRYEFIKKYFVDKIINLQFVEKGFITSSV